MVLTELSSLFTLTSWSFSHTIKHTHSNTHPTNTGPPGRNYDCFCQSKFSLIKKIWFTVIIFRLIDTAGLRVPPKISHLQLWHISDWRKTAKQRNICCESRRRATAIVFGTTSAAVTHAAEPLRWSLILPSLL